MGWVRTATAKISDKPKFVAKSLDEARALVEKHWTDYFESSPNDSHFPLPLTTYTSDWKQRYGGSPCPRGDTVIVLVCANREEFCRYIYRPTERV